jgi:hypothetical protein
MKPEKFSYGKVLCLTAILSLAVLRSTALAANPYIVLTTRTVWRFYKDDKNTVVRIPGQDTIAGRQCYMVEWHPDNSPAAFQTEYWFERNDSVFCMGIKALGAKIPYPVPCLVIAKTTKPGDRWQSVFGSGVFRDTVAFKVEKADTIITGAEKIPALCIIRNSRGSASKRWFGVGNGIVMEESYRKTGGPAGINLKAGAVQK